MRRALAACALGALLVGCTRVGGAGPTGGRHVWTQAGNLRIVVQVEPESLDPLLASNTTDAMIDRLMFDLLVTVDEHGRPIPDLATVVPTIANGGISADGTTVTYHLRDNVKWHDGTPFTSADVAFSYSAIENPKNNVISRSGYDRVKSIDTPDARTVVVHLKAPFAPFVNTFFAESDSPYLIVPRHLLAKFADINHNGFSSAPVGTGPFKFVRWAHGDHIELAPNPEYFLGKPKLASIKILVSSDENTELNQLRTHDVDWQFEASPQEYRDLKTQPDTTIVLQDRNEYERLEINNAHPPLDDVRVRKAIAYALDTQRLTDTLTYGSATRADQDLPPFMWAHVKGLTQYPHDLAQAKSLLQQAGYAPGPDGMLAKNGQKLSLTLVTNVTNATRRLGIVQTQSMLRAAGIDVQTKLYQGALLFAPMGQNGILQNGRFDLAWTGWVAGTDPDNSSLYTCAAQPPNGNNDYRYCRPAMDAAEAVALGTPDQAKRAIGYDRVEKLLATDEPYVPIWWPRQIQPINPDFKHFTPNPVTASWNAYQWEI